MTDKKRKQAKKQRKNTALIMALVGFLIAAIVATVLLFDALKNPERDTMRKCIATFAIQYDKLEMVFNRPTASEKAFGYAKDFCEMKKKEYNSEDGFGNLINNLWQAEEYTKIDNHDRNWYYNQVKL